MALETIPFQQNPISYAPEEYFSNMFMSLESSSNFPETLDENISIGQVPIECLNYYPPPPVNEFEHYNNNNYPNFSSEASLNDGFFNGDSSRGESQPCRHVKKCRTRTSKILKNKEEIENQRVNHITTERNRRKQVNHYLALLRSMMPSSYAQRGDQTSIVGGAINFVKELEQKLQFLEARKQRKFQANSCCPSRLFNNFFNFPQYSTCPTEYNSKNGMTTQKSNVADIEVTNIVESHANIRVLSRKQPKQLYKVVLAFSSMSLTILHMNVTSSNDMVLYTFNVKVEDDCQLTTVNEIATAVHEILKMIQQEFIFSG